MNNVRALWPSPIEVNPPTLSSSAMGRFVNTSMVAQCASEWEPNSVRLFLLEQSASF